MKLKYLRTALTLAPAGQPGSSEIITLAGDYIHFKSGSPLLVCTINDGAPVPFDTGSILRGQIGQQWLKSIRVQNTSL